jgi:NAD(P)-dependent dehydrogenase (short-subunit alcohol dehydrogenase family)
VAGRGLGAAITERLLADGWALSLGLRDPARPTGSEPPTGDGHAFRRD